MKGEVPDKLLVSTCLLHWNIFLFAEENKRNFIIVLFSDSSNYLNLLNFPSICITACYWIRRKMGEAFSSAKMMERDWKTLKAFVSSRAPRKITRHPLVSSLKHMYLFDQVCSTDWNSYFLAFVSPTTKFAVHFPALRAYTRLLIDRLLIRQTKFSTTCIAFTFFSLLPLTSHPS